MARWMAGRAGRQADVAVLGEKIFLMPSESSWLRKPRLNKCRIAGIRYSEIYTGKDIGDKEPCHSTKILSFSLCTAIAGEQ